MYTRAITRAAAPAARRTFTSTRSQMASPFHYPEGPRSNLPFNTQTRFFALRYWGFMAAGFGLPIGMACTRIRTLTIAISANTFNSLANLQELEEQGVYELDNVSAVQRMKGCIMCKSQEGTYGWWRDHNIKVEEIHVMASEHE